MKELSKSTKILIFLSGLSIVLFVVVILLNTFGGSVQSAGNNNTNTMPVMEEKLF